MAHRVLEEAGLFQFASARETVEPFLPAIAQGRLGGRQDEYFDLLMLTSGEVAVARFTAPPAILATPGTFAPRLERVPVEVHRYDATLALQKFDSTPTRVHLVDPGNVHLWDLVLYAGDMSKLSEVSPDPVREIMNDGTGGLIERLKALYREAGNPLALGLYWQWWPTRSSWRPLAS